MTDDIATRLRRDLASGLSASIGDTEEAAAEIERLREALRAMVYAYPYSVPCFDWDAKARAHNLARAALSPQGGANA